ncbi:MAG: DsbC family protein [Pseudomonadota bacterium]
MTCRLLVSTLCAVLASVSMAQDAELDAVRKTITSKFPQVDAQSIKRSSVPGLLEIQQGAMVAYLTADGRYLLQGEIIDLVSNQNVTQVSQARGRKAVLEAMDTRSAILFSPEDPKATVTVFTDIDCGYCRKLHREMQAYNDAGIAVRYLLYPRSGPNTPSWTKAEQVWCADNRNSALTAAKSDEPIGAEADCDAGAIGEHFQAGINIGLNGTPAIVTEDGTLFAGYVPAESLAQQLGLSPQ